MEITRIMTVLKGTVMVGALLAMPMVLNAQKADSAAISDLLKEAERHAALANNDAETLESYSRQTISSQTHGNRLISIKGHANDLIEDFNRLNLLRETGSPWQQEAIDRVNPLLHEMADHLRATINHFNENRSRLQMPPFRDYVRANRNFMNRTSQLISDFVEYGETKARAETLEKGLQLPAIALENE